MEDWRGSPPWGRSLGRGLWPSSEKNLDLDFKYSISGVFWALFQVQLAGFNAIQYANAACT